MREIDIKSEKLMAGVGTLFSLFWLTPSPVAIAGWVLLLLALKRFSLQFERSEIYRAIREAMILAIASGFVFILVWWRFPISFIRSYPEEKFVLIPYIISFLLGCGLLIASSYFLRRCLFSLKEITGDEFFSRAGELLFLGSLLSIILVGFPIYSIGQIYQAIAFFLLPDKLEYGKEQGEEVVLE
ncbi:DUF996 domain-containing protein [bacterium]|nr:DUF996 domain-containing protein [bacterium]